MPHRVRLLGLAVVLLLCVLFRAHTFSTPPDLLGFAPARVAEQLGREERFAAQLSTEHISAFHRLLTRQPHLAGTPEGRALADEIARTLRSFGLETEIRTYYPHLSHPKRLRIRLVRPRRRALPVYEPSDGRDPDSRDPRLTPGFLAYSASGQVRGPVVYVNYGLPADYEALAAVGVDVRGAIVLARYGKVHRAVKVHTAEQRGARGILIYSDPADDGYAQGDPWPAGPWRQSRFVQRGNAKYSWFWHGDPLTPHTAATREAARLKPDEVPTLPKIPAVAISWSAGQEILTALKGPVVPRGFQGALPRLFISSNRLSTGQHKGNCKLL